MMKDTIEKLSRERLLDVAERLFSEKGFAAVTLRDIAQELGLSHASLYYHFPGGKEELFIAVTKRSIDGHGRALAAIVEGGAGDIRKQLFGMAGWFLSQPPLDLIRMAQSDMPVLKLEDARQLTELLYGEILLRVQAALQAADSAGEIGCPDPGLVGGALVGMVESFHSMPGHAVRDSKLAMAKRMIDILLRGLEYGKSDRAEATVPAGGS
jgi:AcrR family transcriptional regulator